MNDFESQIYKMRSWLQEEENEVYVLEKEREAQIEKMNELEEWLYEEGASANFTTYGKKEKEILKKFDAYQGRKQFDKEITETIETTAATFADLESKLEELQETKTWIKEDVIKELTEKIAETKKWFEDKIAEQSKKAKHENPAMDSKEITNKLAKVTKFFLKVARTTKPREKKVSEEKKADEPKKEDEKKDEGEKKEEEPTNEDL